MTLAAPLVELTNVSQTLWGMLYSAAGMAACGDGGGFGWAAWGTSKDWYSKVGLVTWT